MEKQCTVCKSSYERNKKYSQKQWDARRFCSANCFGKHSSTVSKPRGWRHSPETIKKMIENSGSRGKFRSGKYGAVHLWLSKNFNHEKIACDHCAGSRFLEFALKNGMTHEHKRTNYLILCSSCHKRYDYTEERKMKLSASLKGRIIHWKDKISIANRGRILSEAHKKAVSTYQKNNPKKRNERGQFKKI